jgi:hypothetical protein
VKRRAPKKTAKKKVAKKPAVKKTPSRAITLAEPALRWLDSVADSITASGGPRFRREDIVQALIDANSARSLDPRAITNAEALRVAFGAPDLSAVERSLQERTKLEPSLLAALKDSIK